MNEINDEAINFASAELSALKKIKNGLNIVIVRCLLVTAFKAGVEYQKEKEKDKKIDAKYHSSHM